MLEEKQYLHKKLEKDTTEKRPDKIQPLDQLKEIEQEIEEQKVKDAQEEIKKTQEKASEKEKEEKSEK